MSWPTRPKKGQEDKPIFQYVCGKCGHKWVPRMADPAMCPKCKTKKWKVYQDED